MSKDRFSLEKSFPNAIDVLKYSPPPIKLLANDCLYVLDTNALLAPYQIGSKGVAEIEKIYRGLVNEKRLFVPARALREFAKNRTSPIVATYDHLHTVVSKLPTVDELECPLLEENDDYKEAQTYCATIRNTISKYKVKLGKLKTALQDWSWNDKVTLFYRDLFTSDNVIDPSITEKELDDDLNRRTENRLPPGFKDQSKGDGGIGDLIIWQSVIYLGKQEKRSVLLVSNEEKPDWIVKTQGTVMATRPELCVEFFNAAGKHFALINYATFLNLLDATDETVQQAITVDEFISRFKFIGDQLNDVLSGLDAVLERFLTGDDDSEYIDDPSFARLSAQYRHIRRRLWPEIVSPELQKWIEMFDGCLKDIQNLNNYAKYFHARQKGPADVNMQELIQACKQFRAAFAAYKEIEHFRPSPAMLSQLSGLAVSSVE